MGKTIGIIIGVSAGIIVLLFIIVVIWYIFVKNKMRKLDIKIDESESGIDVALTKRYDLLSKLFQSVKGYMKHERETLQKIISLRQPPHEAPVAEKQSFAEEVTRGLEAINVVMEQYPDLKASKNVLQLQDQTAEVEENLQAARRIYNANISFYNRYIVVWPNNIVAKRGGFDKRDFFEAEAVKREDIHFDF